MKCLYRYRWVKLPRFNYLAGGGILGFWVKLASRAAFRGGNACYCGYWNAVTPGMWSGGMIGLRSILGLKSRNSVLEVLNQLAALGYIRYELDPMTKRLTYQIIDWVKQCSGGVCTDNVYALNDYGFLGLPRHLADRLCERQYCFDEADAWLDLWCHTVWKDPENAFSFLAPSIQYGRYGAVLTLEMLGRRWGWEKTKVWRFLKKHRDAFALYRLPSSYGCLIFNRQYPAEKEVLLPEQREIFHILAEIRRNSAVKEKHISVNAYLNRLVRRYSKTVISHRYSRYKKPKQKIRVAFLGAILRAYFSSYRNQRNDIDCRRNILNKIRGPCCQTAVSSNQKKELKNHDSKK